MPNVSYNVTGNQYTGSANLVKAAEKKATTDKVVAANESGTIQKEDLQGAYNKATEGNAKSQTIFIQSESNSNEFIKIDLSSEENQEAVQQMIADLDTPGKEIKLGKLEYVGSSVNSGDIGVQRASKMDAAKTEKVLDKKLVDSPHYKSLKKSGGQLKGSKLTKASKSDFSGFKSQLGSNNTAPGIQKVLNKKFGVKLTKDEATFFHGAVNNGVKDGEVKELQTILAKLDPAFSEALSEHGKVDNAYGYATTKAVNMLSYAFNPQSFDEVEFNSEATSELLKDYDIRAVGVDVSGTMKGDIKGVAQNEDKLKQNGTEVYSFSDTNKAPTKHASAANLEETLAADMEADKNYAKTNGTKQHESSIVAGITILDDMKTGSDGKVGSKNGKPPAIVLYSDEADFSPNKINELYLKAEKKGVKVFVVAMDNEGNKTVVDLTDPPKTKEVTGSTGNKFSVPDLSDYLIDRENTKQLDWWSLPQVDLDAVK